MPKLDVWEERELNRRNRHPESVIVCKIYSGRTPVEICKILFDNKWIDNMLPYYHGVNTRIDYNYAGHKVHSEECIAFFKVTGYLPPRIENDNFKLYRKGIDGTKFNEILYKDVFRLKGKFIEVWDLDQSREKVRFLKDFFGSLI